MKLVKKGFRLDRAIMIAALVNSVQIGDEPQGSVLDHTVFADTLAEPDQLAVDPPVAQAGFSAAGRSTRSWTCPAVDRQPGRLRR
jgi:hypothetical protein